MQTRRSTTPIPHARAHFYGVLAGAVRPRPITTVSSWADKHRILTSKSSGEVGQWRTDRTPYLREVMDVLSVNHPAQRVVLMFAAQTGKALDLNTPIATPSGWTRMGDLQAGDTVFSEGGQPTRVLVASEIFHGRDCYRVAFSDGSSIVADGAHRWTVADEIDYRKRSNVTLTTVEIAKTFKHRNRNRYAIPCAQALDLPEADLPIDPYTLGVWLGDGNTMSAQFTQHQDDTPELVERIEAAGYQVLQRANRNGTLTLQIDPRGPRYGVCLRGHDLKKMGTYAVTKHGRNTLVCAECQRQASKKSQYGFVADLVTRPTFYNRLTSLGLIGNKHIPPAYLRASKAQRMELLRGLMDTDGHAPKKGSCCEISSSYPALACGIAELVLSIGLKPTVKAFKPKGGKPAEKITFNAYANWPVFHLARKKNALKPECSGRSSESQRRRIVAVDAVPSRPVRCIAVDAPSHLFLSGTAMIPTHNTEVGLNWIGYVMHHAPAPMLVVVPTLEVRKRWVRQRLDPLLTETPAIRGLMDGRRQRDSGNAEDMKDFPGGMLVLGGANSPASLSSMPIPFVLCDEVDRFPWEVGQEGDPLGLIDERTKTFPRRKVLLVSTPTVKGASRVEGEYLKSDQRQYHVPCPHCGEYQVLHWKHPDGRYGLTHLASSGRVVYTCAECGAHIEEHHKPAMLARGRWIARYPDRPVRGYQLSGLYSPLGLGFTWAEIWSKWTDAHGDMPNLKRFVNTTLAETWEEAGDSIEDISLISRLEDYPAALPLLARTAWVDVQKDRLEMSVIDWGDHEESWLHDHIIIPGDTAQQDVWDALEDEVEGLGLDAMGVDSGYNAPQVHAFVLNRKWAYATKGIPGMQRSIVDDEPTRRKRLRKRLRRKVVVEPIGVDSAKALIYARLKQDKPGKGTVHFPRTGAFDDEYFAQVAAEKLVTRVRGTRPYQEWVQTRARNEALDCLVGNLAVLRIAVNLEALRARANAGEQVHKATAMAAADRNALQATQAAPDIAAATPARPGRPPVKKQDPARASAAQPQTSTGGWDFERRT